MPDDHFDIMLISPPNEKLGSFKKFVPRSIPLGITILYSYLHSNGYNVKIIDGDIQRINSGFLSERMKSMKKPNIFGISAMTTNIENAYDIARQIKEIDCDSLVIFGGIHPTAMPDEVISNEYVDFLVTGEGERSLLSLVGQLMGDNDFTGIKNLVYRDEHDRVITNDNYSDVFDIKELPLFPYHLFDKKNYDLGFILSSRGCPFNCIFCSQRLITKRRYRPYPLEKVIEELDYLINDADQKNITFFDDYFLADIGRVVELCGMIRKNRFNDKCSFGIQTRGDNVNPEILAELKGSGFDSLMIGFETSSEKIMKFINKAETVEQNIKASRLAKEVGLTVEGTFIFGFSEEKYEDRINAFRIARRFIDRARFNNIVPYPGTGLYDMLVDSDNFSIIGQWSNFSSAGAVSSSPFNRYMPPYHPDGMTVNDLTGIVFLANLLFYINISNAKKLFNFRKRGSGKWFEIPRSELAKPKTWFYLSRLTINILLKAIYYLAVSRECRRFFTEALFKTH